jgi:FkbM family methyltransferase
MNPLILLKKLTKRAFNQVGLDIVRLSNNPTYSLLGLNNLPIETVIDVGANTGQFAKMISSIFPKAHIYCFEPLAEPFAKLNKWADQCRGRVTVFNTALGESEHEVEMMAHLDHSPSSSFLKTTEICEAIYPFTQKQSAATVKLTTLDKALSQITNSFTPDILIKLDVQGYEDRVIKGGIEAFRKARACIIEINLDCLYENQADFQEILSLLYGLG